MRAPLRRLVSVTGLLLVREAGGLIGAVREGREIFESGSVIAANSDLFEPLAGILREPA